MVDGRQQEQEVVVVVVVGYARGTFPLKEMPRVRVIPRGTRQNKLPRGSAVESSRVELLAVLFPAKSLPRGSAEKCSLTVMRRN